MAATFACTFVRCIASSSAISRLRDVSEVLVTRQLCSNESDDEQFTGALEEDGGGTFNPANLKRVQLEKCVHIAY